VFSDSVFELVSSEGQAKMEAAKMQADLAQSQLQKQTSSAANNASASGKASIDSQASGKDDALVAGPSKATSSEAVSILSDKADTNASVTTLSSRPSLSRTGFTPFAKNPAKQKRYEAYLESVKAGTSCKCTASSKAVF